MGPKVQHLSSTNGCFLGYCALLLFTHLELKSSRTFLCKDRPPPSSKCSRCAPGTTFLLSPETPTGGPKLDLFAQVPIIPGFPTAPPSRVASYCPVQCFTALPSIPNSTYSEVSFSPTRRREGVENPTTATSVVQSQREQGDTAPC